ncbi:PREDICTED: uncharacterized protein LOC104282072 [Charadrius vociferus]|uniref:uncharacterized protein LOC104282072 n=1 Tax=Charadrius vociferus TaxID=50402 RepID=UPI000521512D|nr:PREDICTED: uncharacterized protein LOC104282072 [Charadrius vociferus]
MKPKFWCYPAKFLLTCADDIVITSELQPVVRRDRFSISDNRARKIFTVTVEDLAEGDTGTYLCGVRRGTFRPDESHGVKVIVFSGVSAGCWAVTGPRTVLGFLGGSLSVNCRYQRGDEMKPKFWCYLAKFLLTCADDIVVTSELQPVVRRDRFSISDNRARKIFTVTVEDLAEGDTGTYFCGVRRGTFRPDESHGVEVIVSPAPTPSSTASPYSPTAEDNDLTSSGEDTLNYADVKHRRGTAESQLYSNAEAFRGLVNTTTEYTEVNPSYENLEEEKDAMYARVRKSPPKNQEIYANVPSVPRPREEPHSAVRRA